MILCKDCKFMSKRMGTYELGMCAHPKTSGPIRFSDGKSELRYADHARKLGPCGSEARFFEPKPLGWFARLFERD